MPPTPPNAPTSPDQPAAPSAAVAPHSLLLYVKDLPAMARFYVALFGLPPEQAQTSENWLELPLGPLRFYLHAIPPEYAEAIVIANPPEPREETPWKLTLTVPDLAAAKARLLAAGHGLREKPWAALDLIDPEGNIVQLVQR